MNQKKILVTGGAGYIGSHVVKHLGELGAKIIVLDNLSTGYEKAVLFGELVKGDLRNLELLEQLFRDHNFDAVLHFAGSIVVPESVLDPNFYYQNNTENSLKLLRCCEKFKVRNFIFSSTAAVYGTSAHGTCHEKSPLAPINPYGRSKLMVEWMLEDFARVKDFAYVALRYFNVAGADYESNLGQFNPRATHLIKTACQVATGKLEQMNIYGTDYETPDGTCIRDYIHVDDLANAHVLALKYLLGGGDSQILNCGYSKGFSVREVLCAVQQVIKKPFKIIEGERRLGDLPKLIAESDKIREILKWKPQREKLTDIVRSAYFFEQSL